MERKIKGLLVISGVTTILIAFFLALYYCVLNQQRTGPMDWWAIILLAIPAAVLMVSRILIEIYFVDVDESFKGKNLWGKIGAFINRIIMGVATVLVLPIGFIALIVLVPFGCFGIPGKKSFKKLITKGFQYKSKNKAHMLTKNEIVIRIPFDYEDCYISFDHGENFVRVEESDLGSKYDRDALKSKLDAYRNAHPLDKQRGDALPPVSAIVDFLDNNLKTI